MKTYTEYNQWGEPVFSLKEQYIFVFVALIVGMAIGAFIGMTIGNQRGFRLGRIHERCLVAGGNEVSLPGECMRDERTVIHIETGDIK